MGKKDKFVTKKKKKQKRREEEKRTKRKSKRKHLAPARRPRMIYSREK